RPHDSGGDSGRLGAGVAEVHQPAHLATAEGEVAERIRPVLYFSDDHIVELSVRDDYPGRSRLVRPPEAERSTMKNWKQMAEAAGLDIPDMDRIAPALEGLEAAFRPLVKK